MQTERQTERKTDTGRWTERKTDKERDRLTDRLTEKPNSTEQGMIASSLILASVFFMPVSSIWLFCSTKYILYTVSG